jgi:hypothetical protein
MKRGDRIGLIGRVDEPGWWTILLAASAGMLIWERRQVNPGILSLFALALAAAGLLREHRPRLADAVVAGGLVVVLAHRWLASSARAAAVFVRHQSLYRLGRVMPTAIAIGALLASALILLQRLQREPESDEIKRARYRVNRVAARRPEQPAVSKPLVDAGPDRGKTRLGNPPAGRQSR